MSIAEGFRTFNDMIGSIEFDDSFDDESTNHEQERPQAERHISTTATVISLRKGWELADLDLSRWA